MAIMKCIPEIDPNLLRFSEILVFQIILYFTLYTSIDEVEYTSQEIDNKLMRTNPSYN